MSQRRASSSQLPPLPSPRSAATAEQELAIAEARAEIRSQRQHLKQLVASVKQLTAECASKHKRLSEQANQVAVLRAESADLKQRSGQDELLAIERELTEANAMKAKLAQLLMAIAKRGGLKDTFG